MKRFTKSLSSPATALSVAAIALAACESADVSGIKVASPETIRAVSISNVNVTMQIPKPNPALEAALHEQLNIAMQSCATGTTPHRLDVVVTDFEEQDVAKSIFIGDEIELEGRVTLTDESSGEETGQYYVQRSFFWGGLIGAAMMSDAEVNLSKDFAASVCEDVFGVKLAENQ